VDSSDGGKVNLFYHDFGFKVNVFRRNCSFFLLPCCSFDFFHKFNNKPTNKNKGGIGRSKYNQYLDYVLSIGTRLGFEMRVDRLKTCSAKRFVFKLICLLIVKNNVLEFALLGQFRPMD
jgi:hypothetical protein